MSPVLHSSRVNITILHSSPVTITSSPVTITSSPVTITSSPVTITSSTVNVTSSTVNIALTIAPLLHPPTLCNFKNYERP